MEKPAGLSSRDPSAEEGADREDSYSFKPFTMENHEFSLERDADLGFRPKLDNISGPLPFAFLSHTQIRVIKMMEGFGFPCVYRAKRPQNSFDLHKMNHISGSSYEVNDKAFRLLTNKTIETLIMNGSITIGGAGSKSTKGFIDKKKMQSKDDLGGGISGVQGSHSNSPVSFDSEFEGGNLDLAFKVSETEYNLLTRCDTNSKGHNQWFYFRISNDTSQTSPIRLNIINLVKPKSLYGKGAFPYIGYKDSSGRLHWEQLNEKSMLTYTRTPQKYEMSDLNKKKIFMTLSFGITLEQGSERWLAYCIPYTYSHLLRYLDRITNHTLQKKQSRPESFAGVIPNCIKKQKNLTVSKFESSYLRVDVLCKGESLIEVPIIEISDFTSETADLIPLTERPVVYVVCRVHPSESVSSYSLEGFINKLLDDSMLSSVLRKLLVFKIVPMMNPDGVIVGNFRTNLCGDDLNRRYDTPSSFFHPTVIPIYEG